ncbi:SH2 domain-containing adapter protein F-like isoform X1 [Chiloscyllium punctatum]|uniref:SH2 domain-containing adapter protein F-like isoform X1 n=1 Tax=Chiloscyllium punctatum TaxID=137246 RepID=UPI003B635775
MAKWFKEHLGFRSSKGPPQPPKPDYRPRPGAEPDILAAYKLQKERDFEDPYTGGSSCLQRLHSEAAGPGAASVAAAGAPGAGSSPHHHPVKKAASPELKYISPKHRLIKVENPEKNCSKLAPSPEDKVIILEDYADPFDAKQSGVTQVGQEKVTENDGYMEPYEAQKMMAEIRRRGSKDVSSRPLPLYDTPYEPMENGGESDMEKLVTHRLRESRLPEDDERPPGEYDQPWEWKKDRISKAFAEIKVIKELPWPPPVGQLDSGTEGELRVSHCHLLHQHQQQHQQPQQPPQQHQQQQPPGSEDTSVQFDGIDKNWPSPPKEEKVRHQNRLSGSNFKSLKHQSLEFSGALGERVEPNLPLGSQTWYHGAISRTDAENLLRLCKEASYLVRNSETTKNDYSLSLKSNQGFMHMKLTRTKDSKYILGLNSPPFDSVPEIIHYYSSRKLPIKGAEHMSLLYPVAIRTL